MKERKNFRLFTGLAFINIWTAAKGETDAAAGLAPISQRKHVSDER